MARKGGITATGTGDHCWLTQADTKYNKDGVWKTGLILEGQDALVTKQLVDDAVEEAFEEELAKLTEKQRKTAIKYYPYDEDGPHIRFAFKQNRKIKLTEPDPLTGKDFKIITIPIRDAKAKLIKRGGVQIWSGSKLKIAWKPRNVVLKSNDPVKIGVQLNIQAVQIIELKTGGGSAFEPVQGGFVAGEDQYAGDEDPVEDHAAEEAEVQKATAPEPAPNAKSEY